jgi:hypothetical protein
MEINRSVRAGGEQFEEADDLDRVQQALTSVQNVSDPVEHAALLANRVSRAQGYPAASPSSDGGAARQSAAPGVKNR